MRTEDLEWSLMGMLGQRNCRVIGQKVKRPVMTGRTYLSTQTGVLSCNKLQEIEILGMLCLGMESLNLCGI